MTWVGRRLPRYEDPVLVQGHGRYVADLARGAQIMRFVRSPVARGRIVSIKTPAGARVITAASLGAIKPIRALLHRPDYVAVDQPILALDRVTYVGEPIAAVIADTAAAAEDLAEQVIVEIEAETPVVTIDDALSSAAQPVHPNAPNNVIVEAALETPGAATAIAGARHHVALDFVSRRQSAMPLEARGGLATFDLASARITLAVSAQMPHMLRTGIADVLGMSEADLRVIAPDVGGGFGQKMALIPEYVLLVWAAKRWRGKVAWIEDRLENLTASFHGRDQRIILSGAFDDAGKMLALDADIRCNIGAYSNYPVTAGCEPLMAMAELPGPYALREYRVRSRGFFTNTCPMAPYRGVSRPVITTAMERLMDSAAAQIGLDPLEIRRRNLITRFPHTSPTGIVYDEGSYTEAMEQAAAAIDVARFRSRQSEARAAGRHLGIGFSVFSERTGYGTPVFAGRKMDISPGFERVEIAMDPSGFIEARVGASPHGQGLKTTLAQVIADELGVAPDRIRITAGDTDRTPYGWGTFASRSAVIAGGACKLAAAKLRERVVYVAEQFLEASSSDIEIVDGTAKVKGTDVGVALSQLARAAYHQSQRFPAIVDTGLSAIATYDPAGTFSNACHVALVEVDIETGRVQIERFVIVEDAGILINPMIVDGQIHGGVAQGIANALYEEISYDTGGNILTGSLADFLVPTLAEIPKLEIHHLETITDASITGAKGVGEGGAIGAPAAVLNAVSDALFPFGISVNEMPITPERILKLLRERRSEAP